jgi:deazaflavin-dependent oxidoreductase (nitroreductase family)
MTDKLTFTGRASHFFTTRMPGFVKMISRRQARRYADSDGRRSAKMNGRPTFRLVVRGRKSGQPQSVMLMLVERGDELLVCGSQAGSPDEPNWWKNLVAAGRAEAQVGDQRYPVDARILTDAAERAEAWAQLTVAYPDFATYQALTDRVLPVAVLTRGTL